MYSISSKLSSSYSVTIASVTVVVVVVVAAVVVVVVLDEVDVAEVVAVVVVVVVDIACFNASILNSTPVGTSFGASGESYMTKTIKTEHTITINGNIGFPKK